MTAPQEIVSSSPLVRRPQGRSERDNAHAASRFPLTRRQADLLRFIVGYQDAHHGVSPTIEECASGIGITSISAIHTKLSGLVERGWIKHPRYCARGIQVLARLPIPRSPAGSPLYFISAPTPRENAA